MSRPTPRWRMKFGTVHLARTDGVDLSALDTTILCAFAQKQMQPLFEDSLGGEEQGRNKSEVLSYMTPEMYQEFRKGYLEKQDGKPVQDSDEARKAES